jgi:hypothetical protein
MRNSNAIQRWLFIGGMALSFTTVGAVASAQSSGNLINSNQPVMQNTTRAFFIYWLPTGIVLDTSAGDTVGNYKTLMSRFAGDAAGSSYLNIVTQYAGVCGSSPCVLGNGGDAFALGGAWTDTQAYPGNRGTRANALQDSDIQNEVTRAIAQNSWSVDANSVFFVITGVFSSTGALVEECQGGLFNNSCTFNAYCAYHDHFGSNGRDIHYGYLSNASFNTAGCAEGISTGVNGQLASDREVVLMSHELVESITDPQVNTWLDTAGNEIGDKCNQISAIVGMNGNSYNVQQQWSNATGSCVSSFGPSVKFTILTDGDDLRGNSSATAALQSPSSATFSNITLKAQSDSGWGNNESHIAAGLLGAPSAGQLARVAVTLTSHNGFLENNDTWKIQSVKIEALDSSGNNLCSQLLTGNPLAQLDSNQPTASFDTPNCLPAPQRESVQCQVFDDGYTNMTAGTGAVFINSQHQACISDGTAAGTCRKWFGRCSTVSTHRPVNLNIFDDGYAAMLGPTDAVYTNQGNSACKPDGTPAGTCRKWFGRGQSSDGHDASCEVFDDGFANSTLPSDAVFINGNGQSCIPDGTAHGECRRWWGNCTVQ